MDYLNDMIKLISRVREVGLKNFDELSSCVNGYSKEMMIYFMSDPGKTRKINDWGRDEDTDYHIGISKDKKGWAIHETIIQSGAGEAELKGKKTNSKTDTDILNGLKQGTLKSYLDFIHKCYEIVKKYPNEFNDII
ncbi:hypothetical protein [Clostridium sp.]|uniref:hypothetical protein n=1 Tax=Clostridium sp. TaxID=1506 RepID=UPI0035A10618